jgi:hypothetical protein
MYILLRTFETIEIGGTKKHPKLPAVITSKPAGPLQLASQ